MKSTIDDMLNDLPKVLESEGFRAEKARIQRSLGRKAPRRRSSAWWAASAAAFLVAVVAIATAVHQPNANVGKSHPASKGNTQKTNPTSKGHANVTGPFISKGSAETIALRMGQGAGGSTKVLRAKLESVSAAKAALGSRPAASDVSSARMVWVVELLGTYEQSSCSPSTGCLQPLTNQTYYVVIDAATGDTLATGIFNAPVGH